MGEAKRRQALGLGFREVDASAVLASQSQLYKKTKQLRPDLGMALVLLDYTQPLKIGCSSPRQTSDIEWDVSVAGVLNSYGMTGDNNSLPSLPLMLEGYFFTVALNNGDGLSASDVIARLQSHNLIIRIEPKYKYLTPAKKEWVLPLVIVND
jgi:hypothetical protein